MTTENANKVRTLGLAIFNVKETMSQLKMGGANKVMSWGARNYTNFEDKGLLFRVNGFKHKGYVLITLAFDDTYIVHLLNIKCDIKKTMKNVYCDELTTIIDEEIEKTEDYDNRVKKTYGWN